MNTVKRNNSTNNFPFVMDELFKDLMGGTQLKQKVTVPVNIRETETGYFVELMAAGLKKENFSIEVDNDLLTIAAEVMEDANEQEGKLTRREFSYASFKRSFTLPETVKDTEIKASYEDGILKIALPKKEEALPKAKRMIDIS